MTPPVPHQLSTYVPINQISDLVENLSDEDLARLKTAAKRLVWGTSVDHQDVIQETFYRVLAGKRKCPIGLDVLVFLFGSIRSIASAMRRMETRGLGSRPLNSDENEEAAEVKWDGPTAEDSLRFKQLYDQLMSLFVDDPTARQILNGDIAGLEKDKLLKTLGLSMTTFASKRRLIRRRIDAALKDGWNP